jgi:hypothetical protein
MVLRQWLDSWRGLGILVEAMQRQGFQVSLGEHGPMQWTAVFFEGRGGHNVTHAAGVAQEATPWQAVQRAAWMTLSREPRG